MLFNCIHHRLQSFGQIAVALQGQLCHRGIVAECADIHDNGADRMEMRGGHLDLDVNAS